MRPPPPDLLRWRPFRGLLVALFWVSCATAIIEAIQLLR